MYWKEACWHAAVASGRLMGMGAGPTGGMSGSYRGDLRAGQLHGRPSGEVCSRMGASCGRIGERGTAASNSRRERAGRGYSV